MENHGQDRRKFLKRAGTAAAAAPAVATLITATSKPALAGGHYGSGGPQGNNGWGNGPDGENPGSFHGGGVSQGGPGGGMAQDKSKPNGGGR